MQQRQAPGGGTPAGELRLDVLDDDDGGVDQHADRDREAAEAHQVRRQAERAHEQKRCERGERQYERHAERGAQVAEKQHEQDQHEYDGFDQRRRDRADRARDEVAAVVEHVHRDPGGQRRRDLVELGAHAVDDATGVRAAQTEHQPLHGFRLAVLGDRAVAGDCADAHICDIRDANRDAVIGADHDAREILE